MNSKQSGAVKKVMWVILLWFGSVLALFIASTLIKLLMTMAGLHT